MPNRRACDRCHRLKEGCRWEGGSTACTLCKRSKSSCTTLRAPLRQGRRAKTKPLGQDASIDVWEVEGFETKSIKTSTSQALIKSRMQPSLSANTSVSHINEWDILLETIPDCYQSPKTNENDSSTPQRQPQKVSQDISMEQPFKPWIIDQFDDFYTRHDLFMFGPTFARDLRVAIQHAYTCSPTLLHDILMVISPAVDRAKQKPSSWNQTEINRCTTSIEKLRTARITSLYDALAIMALGQNLAAFNLLTYNTGAIFIMQYSLTSIRPWYGQLSKDPSIDTVTITPVFWDTVHCLLKREIPIIKFYSRDPHTVDRMAGLCTTLLPILYDLCVVSHTLKHQLQSSSEINTQHLQHIEQKLRSWKPTPPPDFTTTFTPHEILKMEAQASMYRTASLLICHRLLHPIGTEDDIAISHANSILLDYARYSALVSLQMVTFPILLAALEVEDVDEGIWKSMPLLAAAPTCIGKMGAFVEYVWMRRLSGCTGFIFDVVDSGPEFIVVP
ncbi:uncharacterized protein LY89DRAFT_41780 [Mollisia scopiformis]|uniref:Zn(2)-C6 fungal-type domain-containing protein n=1 Tax=Mollisia scopiformis TaxID=149040 RepID=A0A194XDF5_MOLSC|nr:uncharacterized protein LY89DRAFT_41780 [Mollisia scopiformis]KUJ18210.1 hypothetical protein LY89DRAFT_41780 [Mollisia scopiformis]